MKVRVTNSLQSLLAILLIVSGLSPLVQADEAVAPINYNRQIRPILSNNCFMCHGPDAAQRQGGLRLDQGTAALTPGDSGEPAIVPGDADASQLIARVLSADDTLRMPPADSNKHLTDEEKTLLQRWITEGAKYQSLWSFEPPVVEPLPAVKNSTWPRTPVDHFVLAKLEAEGLSPAPEADRTTLIRRLSLDLTGLPPTPAEVDEFLNDSSANAYEKVVDRLLASPHYGERMALEWLDAARYADTNGYHIDNGRDMTRWRAWVINALNNNMPFDQFSIEQLAGDLLPNATLDQKIASGFNRNHMINFEGGAIPAEYQTAYIIDRVNTTSTIWLGLTVACAQCHDHKYDPITQKDFYQLYAFYNNVPENGLDGYKGNAVPLLKLPSNEQQSQLDALAAEIQTREQALAGALPEIDIAQAAWETEAAARQPVVWTPLDPVELTAANGTTLTRQDDLSIVASGENPAQEIYTVRGNSDLAGITAIRVESLPDAALVKGGAGRSVNGNVVLTNVTLATAAATAPPAENNSTPAPQPAKLAHATADFSQETFPVALAIDDQPQTGWAIDPEVATSHAAVFSLEQPLPADGTRQLTIALAFQSQFGQHQFGKFRLSVTNSTTPHETGAIPAEIQAILAIAATDRSAEQLTKLRDYYREHHSPLAKTLREELASRKKERADLDAALPTAMVMEELPQPRDTFLLMRGQYDQFGEKVTAGVPESLPPLPADQPANRLTLARWLVEPAHPLTARVTVNRYWQMLFGTGLVKTSDDFGSQGEPPTHPALLDWLALEFSRPKPMPMAADSHAAWDVKALIRMLVTSSSYRQSSLVPPALLAHDPENRLLARAPRVRLHAEVIRDQALAVSGLLNPAIGGHSVSPYQPAGLWEELASRADGSNWTAQAYTQSHGADLYRRTMYTFWKRTSPPPTLVTFDAPDRETCTVRRARTNTPLQALVLLNDPTYVEASRKLAERIMKEGGSTPDERIRFAFRLVTARLPRDQELAVLQQFFDKQLAVYQADEAAAVKLLEIGESPRDEQLPPAELAAWTTISSMLLNLDETVTKG